MITLSESVTNDRFDCIWFDFHFAEVYRCLHKRRLATISLGSSKVTVMTHIVTSIAIIDLSRSVRTIRLELGIFRFRFYDAIYFRLYYDDHYIIQFALQLSFVP